jgi:hypothetical protein
VFRRGNGLQWGPKLNLLCGRVVRSSGMRMARCVTTWLWLATMGTEIESAGRSRAGCLLGHADGALCCDVAIAMARCALWEWLGAAPTQTVERFVT